MGTYSNNQSLPSSPRLVPPASLLNGYGTKWQTRSTGKIRDALNRHFEVFARRESFLNAYACYISTSTGPVNSGRLYVSLRKRWPFAASIPSVIIPSTGQQQWMYYKVVVQLESNLRAVNPSSKQS
ncbi:hypothetical protein NC652_006960 [Populus alba x Populus x berolinensis]|nr:hypothetical protein NC652_006960 [Populus alba x Populus x berolinensis]